MSDRFNRLQTEDTCTFCWKLTGEMVEKYADLTGDYNPVHMDEEYCSSHNLGSRLVHGMLATSILSRLAGMHLPGKGSVLMSFNADYLLPVRIGDTITVKAVVTGKESSPGLGLDIIHMKFSIYNQAGIKVIRGSLTSAVK